MLVNALVRINRFFFSVNLQNTKRKEDIFTADLIEQIKPQLLVLPAVTGVSSIVYQPTTLKIAITPTAQLTKPINILGLEVKVDQPLVPNLQPLLEHAAWQQFSEKPSTAVLMSKTLLASLSPESDVSLPLSLTLVNTQNPSVTLSVNLVGTFMDSIEGVSDNLLVMSLDNARSLLAFSDQQQASYLGVSLNDPYVSPTVNEQIRELLGNDFIVLDWLTLGGQLVSSLDLYENIIQIIFGLAFIVVLMNLGNNLSLTILERQKDIKISATLGMPPSHLRWVFILIALTPVVSGIMLGFLLGYLASVLFAHYADSYLAQIMPIVHSSVPLNIEYLLGLLMSLSFLAIVIALILFARKYHRSFYNT